MNKKIIICFLLIVIFGSLLRLYKLPERMNFSSEQGLALLTSADYLKSGFSFLGQRTFLRTTSQGHILFSGAIYNYTLVPLLLLFNYDPIPITYSFAIINIFTGVVAFYLVKKTHSKLAAIFTLFLFMFNAEMINHSMFIWILHYLPLIAFLSIYSAIIFYRKRQAKHVVLLGIYSGLGVNFEYFYLFTLGVTLIYILILSKNKILDLVLFVAGCFLGNFTMILFDFKHNFYNVRELVQYFIDTLNNPSQGRIDSYHFFQFWSAAFWIGGVVLAKIWNRYKIIALAIVSIYLLVNLNSNRISLTHPIGMPRELNATKLDLASQIISRDSGSNSDFNITNLIDNDFRAYTLRYLTTYRYKKKPLSMENYTRLSTLYVLADNDFDLKKSNTWEVTASNHKNFIKLASVDSNLGVYKISN